jgi:hypothetical protein
MLCFRALVAFSILLAGLVSEASRPAGFFASLSSWSGLVLLPSVPGLAFDL